MDLVDEVADLCRASGALRLARSNTLLVAGHTEVDALLSAVTGWPAKSIPTWTPGAGSPDTATNATPNTLVVRDVHLLDTTEQRGLFEAIDAWQGRVRVIATSAVPLYPLVSARQFDEALYYRLNLLCVDAHSPRRCPASR